MSEQETNLSNEEKIELENLEFQEKMQKILDEVLNNEIPIYNKEKQTKEFITLREVIDPEKDIWYTKKKPKPIINENGFNKLVEATGATFPTYEIIEKQSDYSNFQGGQVWIESVVQFPDGEINKDYGVANALNCADNISKANMPIMALKRARSRAFFRSKNINLPVFDESEVRNEVIAEFEEKNKEILDLKNNVQHLERQLDASIKKHQKLFNRIAESMDYKGEKIWAQTDLKKLNGWMVEKNKMTSLESYAIQARIRWIHKEEEKRRMQEQQQHQEAQQSNGSHPTKNAS